MKTRHGEKFCAEHTDIEPHLRTEAERQELLPLLDQLAYRMCMTQAFIIGCVRDAGLTLVPLNHHAREISPARASVPPGGQER